MSWQLAVFWGIFALGLFGTPGQDEPRQARFLSFSVKQQNGIYVRDLKLEEISLRVDDQPVEIRFFGFTNVDLATVLLLENSPRTARFRKSMPQYGQINLIDWVRYQLMEGRLDTLAARGPVLVAEFYQEFEVLEDFSRDGEDLTLAIQRLEPKVEFLDQENIPLGRMLGRSIDLLRTRPEKRRAVVLFTASIDHETLKHLDEYRDMLRYSEVDLYVVSFGPRSATGPAFTGLERFSRSSFAALVNETGGFLYVSGDFTYFHELIDDLFSRLDNSYTIGFYVTAGVERSSHPVRISVGRGKCKVYSREAVYY